MNRDSLQAEAANIALAKVRKVRDGYADLIDEAIDEITSLKARIQVLEEALKPFAATADMDIGSDETDADLYQPMRSGYNRAPLITVGDMRRAATLVGKRK